MLLEALWKDGKIDESISAPASTSHRLTSIRCTPVCCPSRRPRAKQCHHMTFRVALTADASVLLAALRESLATTFGDHGLGSALASLQGARLSMRQPATWLPASQAAAHTSEPDQVTLNMASMRAESLLSRRTALQIGPPVWRCVARSEVLQPVHRTSGGALRRGAAPQRVGRSHIADRGPPAGRHRTARAAHRCVGSTGTLASFEVAISSCPQEHR